MAHSLLADARRSVRERSQIGSQDLDARMRAWGTPPFRSAVSRAIGEARGGSIGFESEEARGTALRVVLPLDALLSGNQASEIPKEVVL